MVQRHASQLPAEKVQTLMRLAKSIHVDLELPAYPAQQHQPQYLKCDQQLQDSFNPQSSDRLPGAGGLAQLATAETPRSYNFEQLVEALGCAQPNQAATGDSGAELNIDSSGAENTHTQYQTGSDLASAAGTVSPYNRY